jgi:hypothetical protein
MVGIMKQLLYVSRTKHPLDQWELNGILSVSRWNNARAGLTGLLLHLEGGFLQLLEGEAAALDRVFGRIRVDTRHWHSHILLEQEAAREDSRRLFPDWPMGFAQPHPADIATEGLFRMGRQVVTDRLSPGSVPALITILRNYYHIAAEAGAKLAA